MAFMVLLERLTPVERAAFLLHDVFDCAYPLIANILRKSEAACRQVVHRAPLATVSFESDGESITALYTVLNPEKLHGLPTVTNSR